MNFSDKKRNFNKLYNQLKEKYYAVYGKYINEAICLLDTLGVNEFAWNYKNVFLEIKLLEEKKIPINGGDVLYYANDDRIEYTYNFWGIDLESKKTSYEQTAKFITDFINKMKNKEKYLFVLVFDYNKYLGLHSDDEDILYIH